MTLSILALRMNSERLPGKALVEVEGEPVMAHIVKRLRKAKGKVVIATTSQKEDDAIVAVAHQIKCPVYRYTGDPNDVVARVWHVSQKYPEERFIFRALGDCPFIEPTFLNMAEKRLDQYYKDVMLYRLSLEYQPVYGAREFPHRRKVWDLTHNLAKNEEREHTDLWIHRNHRKFDILYHEAPPGVYFAPHRLELDWPEDLELIRQVAKGPGMLAPLKKIIEFLNDNPDVALLNCERSERTGPTTSYSHRERRRWFKAMLAEPVISWSGEYWPPPANTTQVLCAAGRCLLGHAAGGKLYLPEGHILAGPDRLQCECGAGLFWREAI